MSGQTKSHPESREVVHRRAFLKVMAVAATAAAIMSGMPEMGAAQTRKPQPRDGHLYMQTNEDKNAIIHYHRSANGALTEVERVATGGTGSGLLSPIYHTNRPNHFEGAGSVIITPDG